MNQDNQLTSTSFPTSPLDVTRQGNTSVTLSNDFVNALDTLQVRVESFGNTNLAGGVAEFPIVGGAADVDSARVDLLHDGGLTFSTPNTTVNLTDFIVTNLGDRAVLTGLVAVNGDLVTRAPLFDLQVGEAIAAEENGRLTLDLENVSATLASDAAAALDRAFGVSAFASGLNIGTAQVDAFLNDSSLSDASTSDNNLSADISELYVFGDLLSDTGNLFRTLSEATGEGFPPPPFFEGRYSNGSLWVESLAPELGVPYNFSTNFALIGAPTGLDNVGNPFEPNDAVEQLGLPGMLGQVNNFLASTPDVDPNGLYTVWAGVYDLGLGITDTTEPVNNIVTAVESLADAGARNILVANLPDLSQFPGAQNIPNAGGGEIVETFNSNLSRDLEELSQQLDSDVNLIQLDVNSLFDRILNNPAQFGFTNATDPYIVTSADGENIRYDETNPGADPNDYVFFGGTVPGVPAQPSAATHAIISEVALSALASEGISATEQLGTAENDAIRGTDSSDNILGLGGNDRIGGLDSQDILSGGAGDDSLNGNTGSDSLLGALGNDFLVGGRGNDILNGGSNNNLLRGDGGQDIFVLNRNGVAAIADFQDGRDTIDLAGALTFSDLNIAQQGSDTAIRLGESQLAILPEIEANSLSAADFTWMI